MKTWFVFALLATLCMSCRSSSESDAWAKFGDKTCRAFATEVGFVGKHGRHIDQMVNAGTHEELLFSRCKEYLSAPIGACSEYKFGSDSALQCLERRMDIAISELAEEGLKYEICRELLKKEIEDYRQLLREDGQHGLSRDEVALVVASVRLSEKLLQERGDDFCKRVPARGVNCRFLAGGGGGLLFPSEATAECRTSVDIWNAPYDDLLDFFAHCSKKWPNRKPIRDPACGVAPVSIGQVLKS